MHSCEHVDIKQAAKLLREWDDIAVICHRSPDGDAVGSAAALILALQQQGKNAALECSDDIPEEFGYLMKDIRFGADFVPSKVVAVDLADDKLFGMKLIKYLGKIDLNIDHHPSNTQYADRLLLEPDSAANAEIIFELIKEMGTEITPDIAGAVYTGIVTDTGGFRFKSTTARSHRIAAETIDCGADHGEINRLMFENKPRARVEAERYALDALEFYFDGRCAVTVLSNEMLEATGVTDSALEGISSIPRTISGVLVGATLRERNKGEFRISVRTREEIDAVKICAPLGGGGHKNAAGCTVSGTAEQAKKVLLESIRKVLP